MHPFANRRALAMVRWVRHPVGARPAQRRTRSYSANPSLPPIHSTCREDCGRNSDFMQNRPTDERIEQFRRGVVGQSNENIPVAVRSIVAPRSAAEQPYRIGAQPKPDLIDQRLDLCRNLKSFRSKIVHGPKIVAVFCAYNATQSRLPNPS